MSDQKKRIVYIEDQPDSAALIERILTAFGYHVVVTYTGHDGIMAALEYQPELILVDLDLPDISGFEVAMHLRELGDFRRTPIIAITSQDSDEYRGMARVAEISGYLTKPVSVEQLTRKIEQYIGAEDLLIDINLDDDREYYDRETVHHLVHKIRELEASNEELRANNRELVEQLVNNLRIAEATNRELRRLDKAKDDFIQRIAHEVRTPLTVVMGYFSVLSVAPSIAVLKETEPEIGLYIQSVNDALERMRKLVDEVVTISRLGAGKVEVVIAPIQPVDLLEASVRPFLEALEQRNITLNMYYDDLPDMNGDVDLLRLALINVIGNAIKYTPDQGEVSISITTINESFFRIMIKDTGVGIDPEEQQRIFDSFYSADDIMLHSTSKTNFRGGGLGLGLATAKAIVELHSGHIYVKSQGHDSDKMPGSIFYIEMPIEPTQAIDRVNLYQSFNQE